ncbi:MAG: hypothetical protein KDK70_32495 [Myxococcales bacterium]|nr:hypothetical protein [Myxococcales bacterium]
MRTSWSWLWMVAIGLSGCRDDAVGVGAGGSDTGESTADEGSGSESTATPQSDGDGPCVRNEDCDDGDPCTADVCEAGVCTVGGPEASVECRPVIDVDFPPRGATLQSASPVVTVAGRVSDAAGAIAGLRINGEEVSLGAQGEFSHDVVAQTGGNIVVLEAIDEHGFERRRVQSFLWSTGYHLPAADSDHRLDEGLAVYLDQESIDDGDPSLPVDDLATLMGLSLSAIDLGSFVDPTVPMASTAGYDVYVTDLWSEASSVSLLATDTGMQMTATLTNVQGDLFFDGITNSTGGFSVDGITATVDLVIGVNASHGLAIATVNPQTSVEGLDLWADAGGLNFLITIIEPFILGSVVADLEASLTEQLTGLMGPAVGLALGAMAPNLTTEFPQVDPEAAPVRVRLGTDFHDVDFHDGLAPPEASPPQGGLLVERGGAHALVPITPYENLGVPDWAGCGQGTPMLTAPRQAPLEIVLTDDLLNQLLHGAWSGGMLEFDMPPALLGEDDALFEELEVKVSGMLAPTASDCGPDGRLRLHMGDIRIDGSLVLGEEPVTFVAYSSLEAQLDVVTTETGISIALGQVERVETELHVGEDAALDAEPTLRATLEAKLVDGVLGAFSGGGLGGIDLPQLDLSGTLGLPPGTAAVKVTAEEVERGPGATLLLGHL